MKLKFKSQKQLQKLLKMNPNMVAIDEEDYMYFFIDDKWFCKHPKRTYTFESTYGAKNMIKKGKNTFDILINRHG